MLHREIPVARPKLLDHELDPVHRCPPRRGPAAAPVDQTLRPLRLVAIAQPPELPLAHPQKLRRLHTAQPARPIPRQPLQQPRHPYLGSHPDPPVLNTPWKRSRNRTDRLLPTPDISSATDSPPTGSTQRAVSDGLRGLMAWRRFSGWAV